MHPRLPQEVESQYSGDEDSNTVIAITERLDSIHRSTGGYGKEPYDKQIKEFNYKETEHISEKQFKNDGNCAKKN